MFLPDFISIHRSSQRNWNIDKEKPHWLFIFVHWSSFDHQNSTDIRIMCWTSLKGWEQRPRYWGVGQNFQFAGHTAYSWNIKCQKYAGMGLDGFVFKLDLFLYYEESLVSSNLNSKLFGFHCVRPNINIILWVRSHLAFFYNKKKKDKEGFLMNMIFNESLITHALCTPSHHPYVTKSMTWKNSLKID